MVAGALCGVLGTAVLPTSAAPPRVSPPAESAFSTDPVGSLPLLTDPFLQAPSDRGVHVVWFTEFAGSRHVALVGRDVDRLDTRTLSAVATGRTRIPGITQVTASTTKLSRSAEDSASNVPADRRPAADAGIVARDVWRHEASVNGLRAGERVPYRVVSLDGSRPDSSRLAGSGTFQLQPLPRAGQPTKILLTSDHQAMVNTPANLQMALATIGRMDAVFVAGDLVNVPDRASEWFDDTRGSAFFPVLQGNGGRNGTNGVPYVGGEIIQNTPLFPAIGNHEVQGRRAGATTLGGSFNAPVPREVAERAYEAVAAQVNPTRNRAVREQWIRDNSFSTTTYEEIFTLPKGSPGGETYYATTIGDVRMISLYSTRIWRGTTANADPAARTSASRYQEAGATLGNPLAQGYGEHIFEAVDASSEQFRWLKKELASKEFDRARYRVVILHEGPQGLGDNIMPVFADPERIEERNDAGELVGVRYEYPLADNRLLYDLQPLLENAGVDLVQNGHSHLWNRFVSRNGRTNFLETSNTGNTYGAFHELSGRTRPVPPAPWDPRNYWAIGNPGGLAPIVPTVNPHRAADGTPLPFVQSNDHAVFSVFDTAAAQVVSYSFDLRTPDVAPVVLDRFRLGRSHR
ncbi:metallophosphoesterase family protein [Parafrankia sp. FMc2]|uniref:metallophosphoesterase family protein n=1 Tax=Parafrankia sp. FMc2 TaxID=3233196 RepID=UPI0034D42E51